MKYMKNILSRRNQSGQIVLIILLLLMVAMTVGITILLDTMAESSITSTEEGSEDSFNASEAAIERALIEDYATLSDKDALEAALGGDLTYGDVDIDLNVSETNDITATGVPQNSTIAVNTEGSSATELKFQWTKKGDSGGQHPGSCSDGPNNGAPASLYVERWRLVSGVPTVERYIYLAQPCTVAILDADVGDPNIKTSTLAGGTYYLSEKISDFTLDANDLVVRVRPLFNDADIHIEGTVDDALAAQRINVVATPNQDSAQELRAIEVERYYGMLPDVFDYVLFSGTTIVQQY